MRNKILNISMLIISIMTILLIPFNLFVHRFPMWIVWADIILLAACTVYKVITMKKAVPKVIIGVIGVVFAAVLLFAAYCCPYWNSVVFSLLAIGNDQIKAPAAYDQEIRFSDAKSDIDQTIKTLKHIHPAFIDGIPENISSAYEESILHLKQDDCITVTDVRREISRIMALLGDGHTQVYPLGKNELYLKDACIRMREGWEPVEFNGVPCDELFRAALPLLSYETESHARDKFLDQIITASGLALYGCDPFELTIMWKKSENIETVTYSKNNYISEQELTVLLEQYSGPAAEEFVYYTVDRETDLAVLTLRQCLWGSEYQQCVRDFFTEVKKAGIGNVAVDLRFNNGGNSMVAIEFIRYLPVDSFRDQTGTMRYGPFMINNDDGICQNSQYEDLIFDGNLFVLTNTYTYSAAMMFAQLISDNGFGTIIGETPGNAAISYTEITVFQLDKTGLGITVSTAYCLRADPSKGAFVIPDVECPSAQAMDVLKEYIAK